MTKQIERIVNAETGEIVERELTQAEIDANANANLFGEQSTPSLADAKEL